MGVALADLPQSVRVLNKILLDDMNPTILAKALNYVGGAQSGTISWSVDRYMIRGFVARATTWTDSARKPIGTPTST